MDLDAFVAVHRADWQRLEKLARRRRLDGAEVDELVTLYQRAATHLSVLRSGAADPAVLSSLSMTVARARSAVTGGRQPLRTVVRRFVTESFPAAVYRGRVQSIAAGAATYVIAAVVAVWILRDERVAATLASPSEIRQYVEHDFAHYYTDYASSSFAFKVWTNNAWVAALCLITGITGFFVLQVIWNNAVNLGVAAGLMIGHGHGALFFGLILPHGLLELTAVFVAAGSGLRLFWAVLVPGPLTRARALALEGRSMVTVALGLVGVLGVSGVLEGFVTPSPLPTWARIAIGVAAFVGFIAYIAHYGGRAVRAGSTGDLDESSAGDEAPILG